MLRKQWELSKLSEFAKFSKLQKSMGTYHDLDVYQRSYKTMIELYKWSMIKLPKIMQYDIGSDMRRAARSVPSNVAEGYARQKSNRDIKNFISTALGSCDEVLFNLKILYDLKLISEDRYTHFRKQYTIIGTGLRRLIKTLST